MGKRRGLGGYDGFTDIEIRGEDAHVIVEAKRGWTLPTNKQLRKYCCRFSPGSQGRALVVMSACTSDYVQTVSAPPSMAGVPVKYVCWEDVYRLAERCSGAGQLRGRFYLKELCGYLETIMDLQDQESNLVYVVALGADDRWKWSRISPVEFITKKKRYFHPYAWAGWPTTPPNYLGFRYRGQLQSIHHVEHCELVEDLHKHLPEINRAFWRRKGWLEDAYLLYTLGPAIVPSRVVKTGTIYRSGRVWAALDLLLTSQTISQARDRTDQRLDE